MKNPILNVSLMALLLVAGNSFAMQQPTDQTPQHQRTFTMRPAADNIQRPISLPATPQAPRGRRIAEPTNRQSQKSNKPSIKGITLFSSDNE